MPPSCCSGVENGKIFLPQAKDSETNRLEEFKDYLQSRGYMNSVAGEQ